MIEYTITQELGAIAWGVIPSRPGSDYHLAAWEASPDIPHMVIAPDPKISPQQVRWQIVFHAANGWNCGFMIINRYLNRMLSSGAGGSNILNLAQAPSKGSDPIPDDCLWQLNRHSSGLHTISPLLDAGRHVRYEPVLGAGISDKSVDSGFYPTWNNDIHYFLWGGGYGGKWALNRA